MKTKLTNCSGSFYTGAIISLLSISSIFSCTIIFPPPSLKLEVEKNSGMVSLLRGSLKLPNNSGLLALWLLFDNSLQNSLFVSLLEVYWESLSSEKPFLLTDVHLENPELSKVLFELIPMDLFFRSR